jgi:SAM-dependent methyltransferase
MPELIDLGWMVTGVDISQEMLIRAHARVPQAELVRAAGEALPFGDASFDAAVSIWMHTDVDDLSVILGEAARVLRPCALLVYIGAHPCFVGPHSEFIGAKGVPTLHPGYRRMGRYEDGPAINPDGLRARSARYMSRWGTSCRRFSRRASRSSVSRSWARAITPTSLL